ncbi:mannitol dehydrogenase family protein [Microbacterium sp. 18062]|uniref:mannitol dehydrogenase family protein n=1 Tax=Microbacterium sp. 18062 TaxID=2681410 RepID=UPI00135899FC|nr:mannitol dehydrogenase family protein [Microbacterium sp. 18062]
MERLSIASAARRGLVLPVHAGRVRAGIVHLGIGAFARAHTAVLTDAAMSATGDDRWGIVGVSQRSATVPEQLGPQDGLFTVTSRSAASTVTEVVASVVRAVAAQGAPDEVAAAIASPETRVVTLTITEKGYHLGGDGDLDVASPAVRADLAGARSTAIGQLAAGIAARDGAPLTVLSCDNLPGNGRLLARALASFADALGGAAGSRLSSALSRSIRFPDTMVDRMVPATTDADREAVARRLGLGDDAAVVAEPYLQWVIADDFAAERPAWERAGAQFVADVAPWEGAKLRILNASHSLLAYLGLLSGAVTVAQAVAVPEWRTAIRRLVDDDVLPSLELPAGMHGDEYRDAVIERFGNPHLGHTVAKVGADGSQKIGPRIGATIRAARARGREPRAAALAVAAWAAYLRRADPATVDDPRRDEVTAAASGAAPGEGGLRVLELIAPDLAADAVVADLLRGWSRVIERAGVSGVKEELRGQQ